MYNNYLNFLNQGVDDITNLNFKSDMNYRGILEHVSKEHGEEYLKLIEKEFPLIEMENILRFIEINDKYGGTKKEMFLLSEMPIYCSPTSLRYIYHACLILSYLQNTKSKNIVEVGCGYGGLCVAINFFKVFFNVEIENYNIIDFKESCNLIKKYLELHSEVITTKMKYHSNESYGKEVEEEKLFFISNYCYTEIDVEHNIGYTNYLLPKVEHGFLVWQNGGNKGAYPVENAGEKLLKDIKKVEYERPQTDAGYHIYNNYFVYF
jgi:hypothetical protein